MKKLFIILIVLAVIAGGGYFGLKQYAPDVLEGYLPSEIADQEPALVATKESDAVPILETAEQFCIRQNGVVQEYEKDDGVLQKICFVNDGMDGVRCDLELFFKRECGTSVVKSAQEMFIESRGIPNNYMIFFSDVGFDENKRPIELDKMTRVESWTFGDPVNAVSDFENDFFVEENKIDEPLYLMEHDISPLWFTENTKLDDVIGLLGDADCEVSGEAGSHTVRTLKYNETDDRPFASVTFSEEQIIAATVGIAFKEDQSSDTLCK